MDILSLVLAFLGIYGIVFSLRLLLARNIVPTVSTLLNETMAFLEHAEAIRIPDASDYRASLAILHNQFLQMRTESHRSPGFFQQLYLLFMCGLTWRLYVLKWRVEAIKRKIELAVDEQRIAFLTNANAQSATTTALPAPAAETVIPMNSVVEPTPPPRAASSIQDTA
jgi:hypothetical protein